MKKAITSTTPRWLLQFRCSLWEEPWQKTQQVSIGDKPKHRIVKIALRTQLHRTGNSEALTCLGFRVTRQYHWTVPSHIWIWLQSEREKNYTMNTSYSDFKHNFRIKKLTNTSYDILIKLFFYVRLQNINKSLPVLQI